MSESTTADRCRELRRRRGWSQEDLADAANISVASVRKVEQGGQARMETLHKIARALGVVTVTFVSPTAPQPQEASIDDLVLADMRSAIHPPVSMSGHPLFAAYLGDPDLQALRRSVRSIAVDYHKDRYDHLASVMPAVVRSAHFHVEAFDTGRDHDEALRLRADITGLAGRYLIQIRAHDLALIALHRSIEDATEIGDGPLAAAAVSSQAWAMLRQGRLGEVERLCIEAAENIEPKMSTATHDQLASWGRLLVKAAAAAGRNNRVEEAREYAAVARTAGARMEREVDGLAGHMSFGPVSAGVAGPEVEFLADHPDTVIQLAERIPRDAGQASGSTWNRHRIDVARAYVSVGNADRATEIMTALSRQHPGWLRFQQPARDAVREILASRPRMPNEEQRRLAEFMDVEG
jgi:transcriptional regulator with XRE-family HTH domain